MASTDLAGRRFLPQPPSPGAAGACTRPDLTFNYCPRRQSGPNHEPSPISFPPKSLTQLADRFNQCQGTRRLKGTPLCRESTVAVESHLHRFTLLSLLLASSICPSKVAFSMNEAEKSTGASTGLAQEPLFCNRRQDCDRPFAFVKSEQNSPDLITPV